MYVLMWVCVFATIKKKFCQKFILFFISYRIKTKQLWLTCVAHPNAFFPLFVFEKYFFYFCFFFHLMCLLVSFIFVQDFCYFLYRLIFLCFFFFEKCTEERLFIYYVIPQFVALEISSGRCVFGWFHGANRWVHTVWWCWYGAGLFGTHMCCIHGGFGTVLFVGAIRFHYTGRIA